MPCVPIKAEMHTDMELLPGMGIPNHKVVRHENFSGFICVQTELVYFIWISLANCG
jgi:hypothetical protein